MRSRRRTVRLPRIDHRQHALLNHAWHNGGPGLLNALTAGDFEWSLKGGMGVSSADAPNTSKHL
jgi:hypothetical protein